MAQRQVSGRSTECGKSVTHPVKTSYTKPQGLKLARIAIDVCFVSTCHLFLRVNFTHLCTNLAALNGAETRDPPVARRHCAHCATGTATRILSVPDASESSSSHTFHLTIRAANITLISFLALTRYGTMAVLNLQVFQSFTDPRPSANPAPFSYVPPGRNTLAVPGERSLHAATAAAAHVAD